MPGNALAWRVCGNHFLSLRPRSEENPSRLPAICGGGRQFAAFSKRRMRVEGTYRLCIHARMSESKQQTLSYASPTTPPPARASRLAYLALVAGILSTPCWTAGIFPTDLLVEHEILSSSAASELRMSCGPLLATCLCVVALRRIYNSDGALRGAWPAGIGLAISLFWLLIMFTFIFLLPKSKVIGPT